MEKILKPKVDLFHPVIKDDFSSDNVHVLDLSYMNNELEDFNFEDTAAFDRYIFGKIAAEGKKIGVGGYLEDRMVYRRSRHFDGDGEPRSIHLGIDIWVEAYTPVYAPLDAKIHSFGNNDNFGDYGATIILQHELEGTTFYTLYGHLSLASLSHLKEGKCFKAGEKIAEIGADPENGHWPPHLHFQLITDMLDKKGDFYGVAPPSEKEAYAKLCPDPNLLLNIDALK